MIRDQLREAYRVNKDIESLSAMQGDAVVRKESDLPPDELVLEDPGCDVLPLFVDVECVAYTLSLTKSTDDRIVYERDR